MLQVGNIKAIILLHLCHVKSVSGNSCVTGATRTLQQHFPKYKNKNFIDKSEINREANQVDSAFTLNHFNYKNSFSLLQT